MNNYCFQIRVTGLLIENRKVLNPPILHITFLLSKEKGEIILPTNEFDENPISDVKFVDFSELPNLGFSQKFIEILENA